MSGLDWTAAAPANIATSTPSSLERRADQETTTEIGRKTTWHRATRADQLREASNPLFNDRKLKLGTFCSNLTGGATMSSIDGTLQAKWENTAAIARMADAMEFEALVPVGRWKGFGGSTNFNGEGFECYTWAAAMGAMTKNSGGVRDLARADHASGHGGEAGRDHRSHQRRPLHPQHRDRLVPARDRDVRRAADGARHPLRHGDEWIEIIKRLWTSEEEFDFDGKYYQVKGAHDGAAADAEALSGDHERRRFAQGPAIRRATCRRQFRQSRRARFRQRQARVDASRKTAWDECKREIQVWTNAYIFQGDTEADARAFYKYCVFEKGDWEGVENLVSVMGINSQSIPAPVLQTLKEHFIAGWVGYPLIGTKEQVVDGLSFLQRAGFDGIVLHGRVMSRVSRSSRPRPSRW